jgi:glutamate synthase (NADPH/NADH) small chain
MRIGNGVEDAIQFIYELRTNDFSKLAVGDKVAVIGMGMTAIDAATQAKRLGAKDVTLIYRRTQEEMPCTEHELNIAKLDGCSIIWLASPKEIVGKDGRVTHLVCDTMKLGDADASGRRSPVRTGETITLEVDMVIKAAGQMPFADLVKSSSLDNSSGKIKVENKSATNLNGVFAGGDCVNGGKEVVDAVQAGKDGAAAIMSYLS